MPIQDSSAQVQEAFGRLSTVMDGYARELVPALARAAKFMSHNGWWLLPELTTEQSLALVEYEGAADEKSLTTWIMSFANMKKHLRLRRALERWNVPEFQTRTPVFQECLWAHSRKKYSLVVTTAVVHVEGIVLDCLRPQIDTSGRYSFARIRSQFASRLAAVESLPANTQVTWSDLQAVENFYNLAVIERLFASFDPRKEAIPDVMNRHAVAHGAGARYGTYEMSTKALLLLDMLHSVCEEAQNPSA